jgi:hypothetical protein
MPINAHPEFIAAEKEYVAAVTLEEKIKKLENMISVAPSHKGAENLRAQLKIRLKKLKEQLNKNKKSGKSSKVGIKKEPMQAIILGKTGVGKSSIISLLTKLSPKISQFPFNTKEPLVGTMFFAGTSIQLMENPAIESEFYDRGVSFTADTLLIVVTDLKQIQEVEKATSNTNAKRIIVFNKIDLLTETEKRKLAATLQSRKYNFILVSAKNKEGLEELKNKIFQSFDKIRIFTKEPGKAPDKTRPIILELNSNVKDAAEKILHGFYKKIKETRIWGPSSKFPGQIIGLTHKLKDLDTLEFKTK